MSLLDYWPTYEEVNRCIKTQAEAVSDDVLLAVHQKCPLAFSIIGPDGKVLPNSHELASEGDILHYLLRSAPEGSLVVPITGDSGVGKSHLIRILDARLRDLPNSSRYLVIRIPKSASLRRVVELILQSEPLQGNKYDAVRAEFESALADIPLAEAVIRFQGELKIALGEYEAKIRQQLLQSPTDHTLKERLLIARGLPLLLSDATTVIYFHEKVLPRIIRRPVEGLMDINAIIDPVDSQFKPTDFDFLDDVEITKAALAVQNYYRLALCALGGKGKVIAADVLNQVVDQATRQLYQLNESLGGKTLGEVISDIRRILFSEDPNKELIILVEDFAALVGIQDTLAKILIQEGETDGQRTQATIRSVIAVTNGYLAGRDTLATRAGREWVLESRFQSKEDVLLRTRRLVAAYLNAARYGEAKLKDIRREVQNKASFDNQSWLVPFCSVESEEDEAVLSAFGMVQGVPLFPFTEKAIDCLAQYTLTAGNELVYTPRYVIMNVIRDVLLVGRDAFINKQFPPPGIGKSLAGTISQWAASQPFSADLKERYKRFISIWGNKPSTLADISILPGDVFKAFNLPFPDIKPTKDVARNSGMATATTKTSQRPLTPEVQNGNTNQIQIYQEALERWVQDDIRLRQEIANAIRQSIAKLMSQRIDWNVEHCLKRDISPSQFSIPNAAGENGLEANPIKITLSTVDPDGLLRGDLLALLRYVDVYQKATNYDDAEDDLARVKNLIDRLCPAVLARLRIGINKQMRSAIILLASNGRLLGLTEKGRTPGSVSSFLFGEVKPVGDLIDAPQAFKDWRQLQRDALELRESLIQLVLETCGCFQGIGKTAYGVDIIYLINSYPDESDFADRGDLPVIPTELWARVKLMVMPAVAVRQRQLLDVAQKVRNTIIAELDEGFDKQATITGVKDVATLLKDDGVWPTGTFGFSSQRFFDVCESFRNSAVKEALGAVANLLGDGSEASASVPRKISQTAQIPLEPLLNAQRFINDARAVVSAAESHVRTLRKQYADISVAQNAKEFSDLLTRLNEDLGTLQQGDIR